jgi:phosphoribosylanthranilate isomerase
MLYSCVGVSSGNQVPTYHENRTESKVIQLHPAQTPDYTFHSKAQLRKAIRLLHLENEKLKEEKRRLQNKVLVMQTQEINYYKGENPPVMKKAAD